ncbi:MULTISPECIES: hypothetical protein [Acinetobacter]|uniref:Uncharacterized protein n=1 Tax=Acinetobacter bereziniae LMG 1003 = CIP 70.12 TaxID=981324 RepID=N9ESE5_ACIBZ|nr:MULTISPECIES: hypothetical protein [Acinetobacter]ENV95558.1 hypothetical protein F938_02583 [Acinetobacter bereziniae LMG 1003 = CIP 70.12]MBI0393661.1 hypothetical protein [Acinetobacter bereziniae]MBJ8454034.1 hypothetical protein [Acinetobacter bereziniae]MBJ8458132.1 hypothetical protein [Acinetobacter bereziniae]MBJ9372736.1 hypothetical protein [Acinetobacter sp. TGL-Y2]
MRTLQFTANCENHVKSNGYGQNACHVTQAYVTDLLLKQLSQYGFKAETTSSHEDLAVSVENHPIGLGVNCRLNDQGLLTCEISAHADEEQVWFRKIATQSMIKQLANAVENSLKQDNAFSGFEWKG